MPHADATLSASSQAHDLVAFLNASPTPYHAVVETARRLDAAGYVCIDEADEWTLEPGTQAYTIRHGGSLQGWHVACHAQIADAAKKESSQNSFGCLHGVVCSC